MSKNQDIAKVKGIIAANGPYADLAKMVLKAMTRESKPWRCGQCGTDRRNDHSRDCGWVADMGKKRNAWGTEMLGWE